MTRAASFDRQCTVEYEQTTPDPVYNTPTVTWLPLDGYEPGSPQIAVRQWGRRKDVRPTRSEGVQQGLIVGRNQVGWFMRWRDDIDSSMRITLHEDRDTTYQIVAGPADYGGRKEEIEMVLERIT